MTPSPDQDAAPGGLAIRRMTREDLAEVAAIEVLSFPVPWTEEMFLGELARAVSTVLVAQDVGRGGQAVVVGFICLWVVEDELHINNLAVHPRWRRRGIADALLTAGLAAGRARGARRALLEVRASNLAAQCLYRRYDFEPVGIRRRYYSQPVEDAIVMALDGI
jgi:ribosomal-protein-alanine N-acetyltransferase